MLDGSKRYLDLINATLREAMKSCASRTDSLAIALDFAWLAIDGEPSLRPATIDASPLLDARVLDGAGHSRPLYRGLALHALNRAGLLAQSSLNDLATTCEAEADWFLSSGEPPIAAEGSRLVRLAFDAVALACGRERVPAAARSSDVMEQIALRQQPDGRFLHKNASDNPEPMWYHELALLHAVTTYAYASGSTSARAATLRAAEYGAEQIQPDHASSHAFALHAFLRVPQGVFLADMMLHAAGVQSPATMDSVSLLLLADALDCMRHLKWRE